MRCVPLRGRWSDAEMTEIESPAGCKASSSRIFRLRSTELLTVRDSAWVDPHCSGRSASFSRGYFIVERLSNDREDRRSALLPASLPMKILVLHGPNLNLFGRREPHIYGTTTLAEINGYLTALAQELKVELTIFQSNHEGALIDKFHEHMDVVRGALVNPAGLTQHGVPLHDAIK